MASTSDAHASSVSANDTFDMIVSFLRSRSGPVLLRSSRPGRRWARRRWAKLVSMTKRPERDPRAVSEAAGALTTTYERIFDWARRLGVRPLRIGLGGGAPGAAGGGGGVA